MKEQLEFLAKHADPDARKAATEIGILNERNRKVLALIKEALDQLRLDIKYLKFDADCLRDELKKARNS